MSKFSGSTLFGSHAPKAPPHSFLGYLDQVSSDGIISGWAYDKTANSAITVDIQIDGATIATVVADVFRQDLANDGIGEGAHGFRYQLPASVCDGRQHEVRAVFGKTKTDLKQSPVVQLLTRQMRFNSWVDPLTGSMLSAGFMISSSPPNR